MLSGNPAFGGCSTTGTETDKCVLAKVMCEKLLMAVDSYCNGDDVTDVTDVANGANIANVADVSSHPDWIGDFF